ncbi:RNA-binding domain-containing protein [Xylariaceae sp. FL1272]|nr:RNA-binding domain-containing protein [Xylariaceae sp. FL1272]
MDRSLDEIVAESKSNNNRGGNRRRRGGGGSSSRQPRERDSYPRDGVRKSTRDDSRGLDSDWVHDKFEGFDSRDRPRDSRRRRDSPEQDSRGTKIRVENLHYDLSREDLEGLFNKIGPVARLDLIYDRAGRSEGVAYVTYEDREDASEAIREYNGANAKGQPIRMSIVNSASRRNPFDNAHMPGRPLAERVTRARSRSPNGRGGDRIDRYVPDGGRRSRSPRPQRRGGRRAGTRRENNNNNNHNGGENSGRPTGRDGRPKKTQEELDAEMADYFGTGGGSVAVLEKNETTTAPAAAAVDDIDMIE